jgi:predicted alpha/beta superfamily hydrolase
LLLLSSLVVYKVNARISATALDATEGFKFAHTLTGDIRLHQNFHSKFLPTDRDMVVYLPPGYDADNPKRYPVLYLQDGQNAFDQATCYLPGTERHFDERAQALITQGAIQPLIIVGIYSTQLNRIPEYTPTEPRDSKRGGEADLYGRMLVEEIKPFIDSTYRTLPSSSNTALGGRSLGGLVSIYLGLKYVNTFGKLLASSPAAFWDDEMIVKYIGAQHTSSHQEIFLSVGAGEPGPFVASTRALREALQRKGWKEGVDLAYFEPEVSKHKPGAWPPGIDLQLKFLSSRNPAETAR